jgi:hypothetical protein
MRKRNHPHLTTHNIDSMDYSETLLEVGLDAMVQRLYANGFSGGKYGDSAVYANTAWFCENEKLSALFPGCEVQRLPNELITVIRICEPRVPFRD